MELSTLIKKYVYEDDDEVNFNKLEEYTKNNSETTNDYYSLTIDSLKNPCREYFYDINDKTPLKFAISLKNPIKQIKLTKLLLDAKADIHFPKTVPAIEHLFMSSCKNKVEILKLFLEAGLNPNSTIKKFGWQDTLLSHSLSTATDDSYGLCKLLIDSKADVNLNSDLIFHAIELGRDKIDIIKLLIDAKVNTNIQDRIGNTPLLYAMSKSKTNIIKLLIKETKDFYVCNNKGDNVFTMNQPKEIMKLLLEENNRRVKYEGYKEAISFLCLNTINVPNELSTEILTKI